MTTRGLLPRPGGRIPTCRGIRRPVDSTDAGPGRASRSAASTPGVNDVLPPDDETRLVEGDTGLRRRPRPSRSNPPFFVRLADLLRRDRPRPLSAGHAARRPLPHCRPARPRRHGRGLPRRRPQARPAGRAEVPARGRRSRSGAADAAPQRSADGAAGVASERLPRLRHRRGRRPHLPVDGVRGRRGSGVAAPAHRPVPGGALARDVARRSAPGWRRRTSAACSTAI